MQLLNQSTFQRSTRLLTIGATSLLIVSCASVSTTPKKSTDAEACSKLNALIADHPHKFASYKKNMRVINNMTVWNIDSPFPMAKNCKAYEWSTGLNSVICNWQPDNGQAGAQSQYQEGQKIISRCLSPEWSEQKNTTQTGGEHGLFSRQDSATVVSIRYFKEQRSLLDHWHTVLYIGDKSNLKAEVQ